MLLSLLCLFFWSRDVPDFIFLSSSVVGAGIRVRGFDDVFLEMEQTLSLSRPVRT